MAITTSTHPCPFRRGRQEHSDDQVDKPGEDLDGRGLGRSAWGVGKSVKENHGFSYRGKDPP